MKSCYIFILALFFTTITVNSQTWKALQDSSDALYNSGKFPESLVIAKQALILVEKEFGKMDTNYINSLNSVSVLYYNISNFDSAIYYGRMHLDICRKLLKSDDLKIAESMNNLGAFYYTISNYKEAEPLYKEALEIYRHIFKTDNSHLAGCINNSAAFYQRISNYKMAESLYKESLEMWRHICKTDDPELANCIGNLATLYHTIGNYKLAESLYKESLAMWRRIYKTDDPDLASCISNLGLFYIAIGNFKEAEILNREALEIKRRIYNSDNPDLAKSINNLALFSQIVGNDNEAESLYKEALEMNRRIFKNDHPDLALYIFNLASFYLSKSNYKEAEPLYKESLGMYRRLFKLDHPDLALNIIKNGMYYYCVGDIDKAEKLYLEGNEMYKRIINNNLVFLSENEKALYWETIKNNLIEFISFAEQRYSTNPDIANNLYNNILMSKSMLLNSTLKVFESIRNSNDTTLIKQLIEWKNIRMQISNLMNQNGENLKNLNLDSLKEIANKKEKELSKLSTAFANEFHDKEIKWNEIQNNISVGEAAIELIRYSSANEKNGKGRIDTAKYAALIIKSTGNIELVKLDSAEKMESVYYNNYMECIKTNKTSMLEESYKVYWSQIADKIKDCKKVYLSLDGIYNQININSLKIPGKSKYLIDNIDVCLVGSTREIIKIKNNRNIKTESNKTAALFACPKFSLDGDDSKLIAKMESQQVILKDPLPSRAIESNENINLPPLPSSEAEVLALEKLFKHYNWKTKVYLDIEANEGEIKNQKSPTVLHIATHGYYFGIKDKSIFYKNNSSDFDNEITKKKYVENPLLRSNLFFAGATNSINNQHINEDKDKLNEDGKLSALEAQNLNLDGTELVVLSACQTGLGEVSFGEGVYGFQRAFLQAGAKAVITSLWKVSDEHTTTLMASFYKHWLSGETKREALRSAQLEMKKNKKTSSPFFWAPFVIIGE